MQGRFRKTYRSQVFSQLQQIANLPGRVVAPFPLLSAQRPCGEEVASLVHAWHLQQRFGISTTEYDLARGIEMRVVFIAQRGQPL